MSDQMMLGKLTNMNFREFPIASIVFEGDYRICVLQGLSIDRLYDLDALTEYTIILNGEDNNSLRKSFERDLLPRISQKLKDKLVFLEWKDLLHDAPKVGYYDQQALKLSLGNYYETDVFLMLDAKNHFTRPTGPNDFLADGKPAMPLIETTEYWQKWVNKSLEAMDNKTADPSVMMPSITPYLMYTEEVKATLEHLLEKYDPQLTLAMKASGGTEFIMYYAHIQPRLGDLYTDAEQPVRTLFTILPKEQEVALAYINEVKEKSIPMFGLHRNRFSQLTVAQTRAIRALWRKHLLGPWEDGGWFFAVR